MTVLEATHRKTKGLALPQEGGSSLSALNSAAAAKTVLLQLPHILSSCGSATSFLLVDVSVVDPKHQSE